MNYEDFRMQFLCYLQIFIIKGTGEFEGI